MNGSTRSTRGISDLITLTAGSTTASFTPCGARLVELWLVDRDGVAADVVLGYDSLREYELCSDYVGATCGRYGNRIALGRFELDGVTHQLDTNDGRHHLHGGSEGFDHQQWDYEVDEQTNTVRFALHRPDGDQGYPGAVDVAVEYRLESDALHIHMTAVTNAPTVVSMVHHSYWNLAGHGAGTIFDHVIQIHGDSYTPVDSERIPTGAIESVENTPFDLRVPTRIGDRISSGNPDAIADGYDHNWVVSRNSDQPDQLQPCATAIDLGSGRRLDLSSTEPGLQFYTGGHLSKGLVGKGGKQYGPFAGFALESQRFPDSPNNPHFPSATLRPGELYDHRMVFAFSVMS